MLDYRKMMMLYERGITKNNLATIFNCRWKTVDRAITRIKEKWGDCDSIPSDLSNDGIREEILRPTREADIGFLQPDFSSLSKNDLRKMSSVLWGSYCAQAKEQGKKPYRISKFNELLSDYKKSADISYTQSHEPGLACQVDWTGDHGHFMDDDTGRWIDVHILVIVLPYSGYFYAEGFLDEKMDSFLEGHEHAFRYFGGVPSITVPDNCATATDRKAGMINTQYTAFLDHYGSLPKPTRIKAPKDKGSAEAHVKIVEKRILPVLDRLPILSLDEYNRLLIGKVRERNEEPFKKREGSRLSIYSEEEKSRLQPLPEKPYQRIIEKEATVSRDFHLQYCNAFYSVPVDYIGQKATVRDDGSKIRIYSDKGILIAEHQKASRKWQRCTDAKHIPEGHSVDDGAYSLDYFITWAGRYGSNMEILCKSIVNDFRFPVQSFRTLNSILSRASKCNDAKAIDEAAERCYADSVHSAKGFSAMLLAAIASHNDGSREQMDLNSIYCTRYKEDDDESK